MQLFSGRNFNTTLDFNFITAIFRLAKNDYRQMDVHLIKYKKNVRMCPYDPCLHK